MAHRLLPRARLCIGLVVLAEVAGVATPLQAAGGGSETLALPAATAYGPRVPRRLLCDPKAWPRAIDGALCDAARLLASLATEIDLDDTARRQDLLGRWAPFLVLRQGVPDPRVHAAIVRDARYGVVYDELTKAAARLPQGQRLGVGLATFPQGAIGVLLSIDDAVLPAPFPRHPPLGRGLEVRCTLAGGTHATRALLELPSGEIQTLELVRGRGVVTIAVPPLTHRGIHQLQLLVDRGLGPEIGLLAPLLVDATEPRAPAPGLKRPDAMVDRPPTPPAADGGRRGAGGSRRPCASSRRSSTRFRAGGVGYQRAARRVLRRTVQHGDSRQIAA